MQELSKSNKKRLKGIIEGILFAAGEPVALRELEKAMELDGNTIQALMSELEKDYGSVERGLRLVQVNHTWQLSTKPEHYDFIRQVLGQQEATGLSKAALETLSIIAYRQPITRIDIDNLRGVSSNSSVQRLLDRGLIKEAGRMEAPGRPILYKTTPAFLKTVHLKHIEDLPAFEQFAEGEQQKIDISASMAENMEINTVEELRLQKYMAQCGVASRRKSEEMIAAGRVCVNGEAVLTPGLQVDPEADTVTVDGKTIAEDKKIYVLLNKPKGVVSTSADRHADQTVMDLLPIKERLFTVGRLDKDTEGLLILTNDGDLTFRLTHPSHEFNKIYEGLVKGIPSAGELRLFAEGVQIEDDDHTLHTTAPASVQVLKTYRSTALLEMTIHEGRKRQIRKMCAAIGHPVIHLKRTAIGSITLKGLKAGEWRYLTEEEIRYLRGEKDD